MIACNFQEVKPRLSLKNLKLVDNGMVGCEFGFVQTLRVALIDENCEVGRETPCLMARSSRGSCLGSKEESITNQILSLNGFYQYLIYC